MRSAAAIGMLLLLAVGAVGCGSSAGVPTSDRVAVPNVVGMPLTRAACELAAAGLRWRLGGDSRTQSRPPLSCQRQDVGVAPDPPIERQRPPAGHRVRPGSIVVLEDTCTLLRFKPRGAACA